MRPLRTPFLALALMAKAPIAGEAKTRLGATVGHATAATIYGGFLADTVEVIDLAARRLGQADRFVVCPDDRHASRLRELVDDEWTVFPQHRAGLMGGIVDAFEAGFAGGASAVVVTDADSPLALLDHLVACIGRIIDHDLVLGPTLDGGYYLIAAREGARPYLPDLLLGGRFESTTICAATIGRARALDLAVGIGPEGFDVDTRDELDALAARLSQTPGRSLRHTRAILRALDVAPGTPQNPREALEGARA